KMCLYWGISPYYFDIHGDSDPHNLEVLMVDKLKRESLLANGDKIVVTVGDGKFFRQGTTNSIRVETIKDVTLALKNTDQDSLQEVSFNQGKILLDTTIC